MNNHRILFIPILIIIISLAACSAPDTDAEPAAAPGFERSTQAPPPPPGPDEDETFVVATPPVITQEPADPYEGLTFKNGWAKIPFNSTIFGGYGTDQMNDVTAGGPGVVIVGFNIRNGDMNADVCVWRCDTTTHSPGRLRRGSSFGRQSGHHSSPCPRGHTDRSGFGGVFLRARRNEPFFEPGARDVPGVMRTRDCRTADHADSFGHFAHFFHDASDAIKNLVARTAMLTSGEVPAESRTEPVHRTYA